MLGHGTFRHDVLGDWALDPFAIVAATVVLALYVNGWRPTDRRVGRDVAFVAGVLTGLVALISPIHVAAEESLAWHMVQHVLLVGVAAPLIAASAPGAALLRGLGVRPTGAVRSFRRRAGVRSDHLRRWRNPLPRLLVFVLVFWGWHSGRAYSAAVEHEWVHSLEHVSFVAAALLVWSSVLGPARASGNADPALRVLVVFLLALQGVLLSALMTFSQQPWYPVYVDSLGADALGDQHLAGVLMWVPLGALNVAIGVWAMMTWIGPDDS